MASAWFRFYEELNDFLRPEQRKRTFAGACAPAGTVEQALDALGVPPAKVELILVNGESVGFDHRIRPGDRIAVYPTFETFDITPLLRVRAEPLRRVRFLADASLGRLARRLRLLGFDTVLGAGLEEAEIARRAAAEHRIILTRDRGLLARRTVTHACRVRATRPLEQLAEIVSRLQLPRLARPFTRCRRCNHAIAPGGRAAVRPRIEPGTPRREERFLRCPACDRIGGARSHRARIRKLVARVLDAGGAAGTDGREA